MPVSTGAVLDVAASAAGGEGVAAAAAGASASEIIEQAAIAEARISLPSLGFMGVGPSRNRTILCTSSISVRLHDSKPCRPPIGRRDVHCHHSHCPLRP